MFLSDHQHQTGIAIEQRHHDETFPLRLCTNRVFVKTGDHVDGSTHQRGQRLGTSAKVGDVDVQAFILEESQLAGNSEREIDELRLSSDRHLDCGPLLGARTGEEE